MTAVFGLGMVTIGSSLPAMEGSGARLMVQLAGELEATFGAPGPLVKWAFLVGAWAAVFTSLLGVWQSTPYLFADLWRQMGPPGVPQLAGHRRRVVQQCDPQPAACGLRATRRIAQRRAARAAIVESTANKLAVAPEDYSVPRNDANSFAYQGYLYAIASVPIIGLVGVNFPTMMKVYAIVGAMFIPMLAAVLLYLNGQARWIGEKHKNTWRTTIVLAGALLLFAIVAAIEVRDNFFTAN